MLRLAGKDVLALLLAHRQNGLVDDVSGSFVIDEGARAELGNGEKAGTGKKLVATSREASPGI